MTHIYTKSLLWLTAKNLRWYGVNTVETSKSHEVKNSWDNSILKVSNLLFKLEWPVVSDQVYEDLIHLGLENCLFAGKYYPRGVVLKKEFKIQCIHYKLMSEVWPSHAQ